MSDDVFGIVGTTQAGMFRVERVVAEGGFAVIYRAYHEGFRAPVALKCLKVPDAMSDAQRAAFLEKFREEGELLFRLSALVSTVVRPLHVDILVLGETIVPFLALEWLEGEGLDQIVEKRRAAKKPPIDVRRLVPFLQPAAQALAQAHQVPGPDGPVVVIHRDLKPENIFVARQQDGEVVKILDFGIARTKSAAQLDAGEVTSSGALDAFTPGYAAPEQWLPKRYGQVGPWTDVFGLALTMVEVLAGRPAIDGDMGAMATQTTDPARRPTPRTLGVNVDAAVEQAFARALAVDPRERTRSIAAFWTELEKALGMPPSINLADARPQTRSLTGTSEPPPPPLSGPGTPRALAPTQVAAAAPSTRVRRPEGDMPPPRALPADAPGVSFELAASPSGPSSSGPRSPPKAAAPTGATPAAKAAPTKLSAGVEPPVSGPKPRAPAGPVNPPAAPRPAVPIQLAAPLPRERGTLAGPSRGGGLGGLKEQLTVPAGMILGAIAISLADSVYTRVAGELFTLGSLRPMWVSAPLALIGVGLAAWRLLSAL